MHKIIKRKRQPRTQSACLPCTGHHTSLQRAHFLAHLSATLSSALTHVFTPSLAAHSPELEFAALRAGANGEPHLTGGATTRLGYAQSVNFHLYVLSNHQSYDALEHGFVERLKSALLQLQYVLIERGERGALLLFSCVSRLLSLPPALLRSDCNRKRSLSPLTL
jgi:hypothetical protein